MDIETRGQPLMFQHVTFIQGVHVYSPGQVYHTRTWRQKMQVIGMALRGKSLQCNTPVQFIQCQSVGPMKVLNK